MRDKVILILTIGILIILGVIVIGDFVVSLEQNEHIDESITQLLQTTITGLIGIIGTYFGMNSNGKNKKN